MFGRFKTFKSSEILDPDEILADSVSALSSSYGAEGKIELPIGRISYTIFLLLVFAGILYLLISAALLQLKSGERFFAKSQENRFMVRPVYPARGVIYDNAGKPLVDNQPSFSLIFEKERFLSEKGNLPELLENLSRLLKKPPSFFSEAGLAEDTNLDVLPDRIFVAQGLAPESIVPLVSRLNLLPGIKIFESFRRIYRSPLAFSHVLGFVGKISSEDLEARPELSQEETLGKSGIELFYDNVLRGRAGKKIVEIDALGQETRFRLVESEKSGSSLALSIDGELQAYVYEVLRNYIGGAKGASAVLMDPRTGAIRALVSFPGYDINSFGYSLSPRDFGAVLKNPLKPLFNRAVSGEFPTGSTIKPLIGAAALEEKIIDPRKRIYDQGFISIPHPYRPGEESIFPDWRKHGWINFYDAIALSANVYFYMLGGGFEEQKGLGIERIKKYANAFGLGSVLGLDLPGEKPGLIPDPSWKKISEPRDPIWRVGDTYNVSIGQGGMKATPLQMAALTSALANGGRLLRPYILERVFDETGKAISETGPQILREGMVEDENLAEVVKGMRQTVTAGTARLLAGVPAEVAAKTGTAQAGSGLPHAWVTALAPFDSPEIAMVIMVEHAGEGSTVAVPIARDILTYYFTNKK